MTALATEQTTGRRLLDPELFERLVTFLEFEEDLDRPQAERVMDQALAFIDMAGHRTDVPLSPSRKVDPGWHAFMLHSREYADFCHRRFGTFLHHNPLGGRRLRDGIAIKRTVQAIEEMGYAVDHELWGTAAECNPPACCGDGDGC
ncbi:glycine-rich domain-containing protein [Streptomyces sp. NPDC002870]|uniref:glycine-rich domain-containing protein n=1 Tax=Streptomyces sp. NPDC002870 TaxID=3364666 RepID=UPI0036A2BE49